MSSDDELLPEGIPSFDDPVYDALRADLASARLDAPLPDDVAARLDQVLADLAQEHPGSTVVPLRRRSRLGPRLLGAAAAAVLVLGGGVGIAQMNDGTSGSDDKSVVGAPNAAADSGGTLEYAPELPADADRDDALDTLGIESITSQDFSSAAARLISVNRTTYSLKKLQDEAMTVRGNADPDLGEPAAPVATPTPDAVTGSPSYDTPEPEAAVPPDQTDTASRTQLRSLGDYAELFTACHPEILGTRVVPIVLDDRPAVLVIYPVVDGQRRVEARDCSGARILASAILGS